MVFQDRFFSVLAVLELTLWTRLALNSQGSPASASQVLGLKGCATNVVLPEIPLPSGIGLTNPIRVCWCPSNDLEQCKKTLSREKGNVLGGPRKVDDKT